MIRTPTRQPLDAPLSREDVQGHGDVATWQMAVRGGAEQSGEGLSLIPARRQPVRGKGSQAASQGRAASGFPAMPQAPLQIRGARLGGWPAWGGDVFISRPQSWPYASLFWAGGSRRENPPHSGSFRF